MCMSFCTFSTAVMASPREAFGARLNDTVIAGNCPWWLIESSSVVLVKWQNALSGTSVLSEEVVAARMLVFATFSALVGAVSVLAAAVYCAVPVRAFDPAEDEPEAENEVAAPAPLAPEEALGAM